MNAPAAPTPRPFWRARLLTPRGLIVRAALLTLAFAIAHAAGLRENTCILCGSLPTGDAGALVPLALGVLYVLLYAGFVFAVPIAILAAGVQWLFLALFPASPAAAPHHESAPVK